MEKDERKPIFELSDAEFLSFLYAERDRENNMRQYQGWNIWALAGAIATVLCGGYYIVKGQIESLDFINVLYLVSGVMAFLLCYRNIKYLFAKERGYDPQKVKFLKDVTPISFLLESLALSASLSILIIVIDKENRWNVVSIGWMAVFVLFVVGLISVHVNRDKIVKSNIDELVFPSIKWDKIFNGAISYTTLVIWMFAFRRIKWSIIGTANFELSVCIIALVLLVALLIKVYESERAAGVIDVLIDDYVYKDDSKESTFKMLRMNRTGRTALESCAKEITAIGRSMDDYGQKKDKIESIVANFEQGEVDYTKLRDYHKEIIVSLAYLHKCSDQCIKLGDKLKQVLKQVPELCEDKEFQDLVKVNIGMTEKSKELVEATEAASDKMAQWIGKYHCVKYGGLCGKMGCEHRNDKAVLGLRVKRLFNRKAMLHNVNWEKRCRC